jgi:2'-5' RNA ligase
LPRPGPSSIADALGADAVSEDPNRFRPHLSVAYIAAAGSSAPYVDALRAVHAEPAQARVSTVELIEMHRDNRMYEWAVLASLPLD